jgi:hypothetical protein
LALAVGVGIAEFLLEPGAIIKSKSFEGIVVLEVGMIFH